MGPRPACRHDAPFPVAVGSGADSNFYSAVEGQRSIQIRSGEVTPLFRAAGAGAGRAGRAGRKTRSPGGRRAVGGSGARGLSACAAGRGGPR
ncbi:hypothetical protein KCH_38380 [Kitasatospora cheerisanensis KCTC 2395]|uniref:Uncharacterized protein n=1 Tax=Kitasatospora cheerisanensis KCTC 2395 TaxID=1348663 RepID=A0A066YS32_9ACTN|nr:hypothetical protein KCH_38380 [Kitasatospora cheerisanensis KCTC 2395]